MLVATGWRACLPHLAVSDTTMHSIQEHGFLSPFGEMSLCHLYHVPYSVKTSPLVGSGRLGRDELQAAACHVYWYAYNAVDGGSRISWCGSDHSTKPCANFCRSGKERSLDVICNDRGCDFELWFWGIQVIQSM